MKTLTCIVLAVVVILGGFYILNDSIYTERQPARPVGELAADYRDITFTVSGELITLVDGYAEQETVPTIL